MPMASPHWILALACLGIARAQYLYSQGPILTAFTTDDQGHDDYVRQVHSRQYWSPFGNSYQPQVTRPNQYFSRPTYPNYDGTRSSTGSRYSSTSNQNRYYSPSSSSSPSSPSNGYQPYFHSTTPVPDLPVFAEEPEYEATKSSSREHLGQTTERSVKTTTLTPDLVEGTTMDETTIDTSSDLATLAGDTGTSKKSDNEENGSFKEEEELSVSQGLLDYSTIAESTTEATEAPETSTMPPINTHKEVMEEHLEIEDELEERDEELVEPEIDETTIAAPRGVKKINDFPKYRTETINRPFPFKKNRLHYMSLSTPTGIPSIFGPASHSSTRHPPVVFLFNGRHRNNRYKSRQKIESTSTLKPTSSTTTPKTTTTISTTTTVETTTRRRNQFRQGWKPSRWRPAFRYPTSRITTKIPLQLNTQRSSIKSNFKPVMSLLNSATNRGKIPNFQEIDDSEERLAEERRKRILQPKRPVFIQQLMRGASKTTTEHPKPKIALIDLAKTTTPEPEDTTIAMNVNDPTTESTTTDPSTVGIEDTTTEMTEETTTPSLDAFEDVSSVMSTTTEEADLDTATTIAPVSTTLMPNPEGFVPFLGEAIPIASDDIVMSEDGLVIHIEEFEEDVEPPTESKNVTSKTVLVGEPKGPKIKTFKPYPYIHPPPFQHKPRKANTAIINESLLDELDVTTPMTTPMPTTTLPPSTTRGAKTARTTRKGNVRKVGKKATTTTTPILVGIPAKVTEIGPPKKQSNDFNSLNFFDRYYKSGWADKDVKDMTRTRTSIAMPHQVASVASVQPFSASTGSRKPPPEDNIPDFLRFAIPMQSQPIDRKMDVVFDGYARYVRH
eukprot:TCALIF_03279-PA protein Name:"Protein of unknown function" AED:0.62 eAED:0.62 QI:0/0/0/0.33/1/1/3/0/838